jgi:hypothetical protein
MPDHVELATDLPASPRALKANLRLPSPVQTFSSPTASGSGGISITSLTNPAKNVAVPVPIPSAHTGPTTTPESASTDHTSFDIQTLQGIQLHLNHGVIEANSPVGSGAAPPFTVSEEEEFLIQHYARRIGKWV